MESRRPALITHHRQSSRLRLLDAAPVTIQASITRYRERRRDRADAAREGSHRLRLSQRRCARARASSSPASSTTGRTRTRLPDAEKAAGMALFCQAKPLTDIVIEVREMRA